MVVVADSLEFSETESLAVTEAESECLSLYLRESLQELKWVQILHGTIEVSFCGEELGEE